MKRCLLQISIFLNCILAAITTNAQTCGINSVSIMLDGGASTPTYLAAVNTQGNWVVYAYEWKVNGEMWSSNYSWTHWPPSGYNEICLTAKARNISTGDSCVKSYCNIYYSPGEQLFPKINIVSINGLTVTFSADFITGDSLGIVEYEFAFDGIPTSSQSSNTISRTYPAPGIYQVGVNIKNWFMSPYKISRGQGYRTFHVGNGNPNITIQNVNKNSFCDSLTVNATSSPQHYSGKTDFHAFDPFPPAIPMNAAGFTYNKISKLAGVFYSHVFMYDSLGVFDKRPILHTIPGCNVIPDTISGTVFLDSNFNGRQDAGEPGLPNKQIFIPSGNFNSWSNASYSTYTDSLGKYKILAPHEYLQLLLSTSYNFAGLTITHPNNFYNQPINKYTLNLTTKYTNGVLHKNYNFGVVQNLTKICGKTFLDDNIDNVYTPGFDRLFASVTVRATNSALGTTFLTTSNNQGDYCFDLPAGNYTIQPVVSLLDSISVVPDSIIVNSPTGGTYNNRNFGFTSPVPTNLGVIVFGSREPRPGFNYSLGTRVTNTGFMKAKGTVVLNYPAQITPLSHQPANGILNTTNKTITWTTDSIGPGAQVYFTANFNVPVTVPLGANLNYEATVTTLPGFLEHDFSNNTYQNSQIVVGSYDPNDKLVSPSGIIPNGVTQNGERLFYRINFQNTGTASAINVLVMDTIDPKLDLNTFWVGRTSHSYKFSTDGRVLIWRFNDINLLDSGSNQALSQGYIEYSIKPVQGLMPGNEIRNTADIYFDFNPPIITNTTLNTVPILTSLHGVVEDDLIRIYPVPAGDLLVIENLLLCEANRCQFQIELYNLTGQKLRSVTQSEPISQMRLNGIDAGVYLLRISGNGKTLVRKVVKG